MSKKLLTLVWLVHFALGSGMAQSSYELVASDPELKIDQVVEVCAPPSIMAAAQPMVCVVSNCSYGDGRGNGVLLSELEQRLSSVRSHRLFGQRTMLHARDAVCSGPDYYVLGNVSSAGLFISKINTSTVQVAWTKGLAFSKPGFSLEASDLLWYEGGLLVLSNQRSDQGKISGFVVSRMSDQGELLWSKTFEGSSITAHDYQASSLTFSSDKNILVSGIRTNKTAPNDRAVFLIRLSDSGQSQVQKILTFFNAFSKRLIPENCFLDVNGVNIHLAMQASDQGLRPGALTITMIDNDLEVRTWRNYSPRFRMEDFKIGSNKFLMCGQITGDSPEPGYALVGINNANAIPEIVDYNRSGFLEADSAHSSSAAYHRTWQRYILAGLKHSDSGSKIFLEIRPERKETQCVDTFSFVVTKDPIQNDETLDLAEESAVLETIDLNLFLEPIVQQLSLQCNLTSVEDQLDHDLIYPTASFDYLWIRSSNPAQEQYFITGMDGRWQPAHFHPDQNRLDIRALSPGLYVFIQKNLKTGQLRQCKFVKTD